MRAHLAYCSACDKEVHIVVSDDARNSIQDPGAVCLEIGHKCTGSMCPIGAAPPAEMAARLVRLDRLMAGSESARSMRPPSVPLAELTMAHTHEYDCVVCGAHFDSEKELQDHNQEKHTSQQAIDTRAPAEPTGTERSRLPDHDKGTDIRL